MLRAIFKVDPTLSNEFYFDAKASDKNAVINIELDTGEKLGITRYDKLNKISIPIPEKTTKISITSDDDIINYGIHEFNSSIISIEELTSDTIISCNYMFYGFTNVKEIKNINLNWNKITSARCMCENWYSFNGVLPDNFCSDMTSLVDTNHMFDNWYLFNQKLPDCFCNDMTSLIDTYCMFMDWRSYNQKLPDGFCSNMVSLKYAEGMFYNWESYNQKLSQDFCRNMISLKDASCMFSDWHSYNQQISKNFCSDLRSLENAERMFKDWCSYSHKLPDTFFPDTSYIGNTSFMFWGWHNCDNTPKYYLPEFVYNYKQKDIAELNELLKKEEVIDYQLMSKLGGKEFALCIKGNIDHYVVIDGDKIDCFYDTTLDKYINLIETIKQNDFITIR